MTTACSGDIGSVLMRYITHGVNKLLPQFLANRLPTRIKIWLGVSLGRWEYQLGFWDNWFRTEGGAFHEDFVARTDPTRSREVFPKHLDPYIELLRSKFEGEIVKILDVGSGPISVLIWGQRAGVFELTCVDALGRQYQKMFEKYNLSCPLAIDALTGESMSYNESFHKAYARNALDHCLSPRAAFQNMVKAVKVGGYVVIGTAVDEGTYENWMGGHQYNLDLQVGHLLLTDRLGSTFVLTEHMPLKEIWSQRIDLDVSRRQWVDVVYQKTASSTSAI
jgi:SAM-dependent methyltransferase